MPTHTAATRDTPLSTPFKIGWLALLTISALATLGHIGLSLAMMEEATLFLGWAAFNLYSTIVLYIPFRRGEPWAWYTTWLLVVGFAAPILLTRESFVVWYIGAAGIMALSLLLTRAAFLQKGSGAGWKRQS